MNKRLIGSGAANQEEMADIGQPATGHCMERVRDGRATASHVRKRKKVRQLYQNRVPA